VGAVTAFQRSVGALMQPQPSSGSERRLAIFPDRLWTHSTQQRTIAPLWEVTMRLNHSVRLTSLVALASLVGGLVLTACNGSDAHFGSKEGTSAGDPADLQVCPTECACYVLEHCNKRRTQLLQ